MTPTVPPTSAVRVFAKSMHLLAVGWLVSIGWLWLAGVQQHLRRRDAWPPYYGAQTIFEGTLSALVIEVAAVMFVRWAGPAPDRALERREWIHAFWWSLFPIAMLLLTVYVMIEAAR